MSHLFILNLVLAMGFTAVMGQISLTGFISGFIIGYLALWVTRPLYEHTGYFARVRNVLMLMVSFVWQLIISNFRVLWDVITPSQFSRPAVIAVPLDARTDFEILLLANMISLTPGSLTLDVSADRTMIYVHVMFLDDIESARREIKEKIEKPLLEAVR